MNKSEKRRIYNKIMESVSKIVKKRLLTEGMNGYDMIFPSVQRWIDDQMTDTPKDFREVNMFL